MKLEAGKEMDRQCVMNWLNEVYVTPSRAFSEYTDEELKMFAHDAVFFLKELEREIEILKESNKKLILKLKTDYKYREKDILNSIYGIQGVSDNG